MNDIPLKLFVTIVDRGKGIKAARIYKELNVSIQNVILGKGTASSETMDYLGLDEPEKDILLSVVPAGFSEALFKELNGRLHFDKPGKGIAFSLPLSGISTMAMARTLPNGTADFDGKEETNMEHHTYHLIITVVDHGQSDMVMKFAKEAGATGGTVTKSREILPIEEKKLFGMTIQPEKEIVLILAPSADKTIIMKGICKGLKANGIFCTSFSVPIDEAEGIRFNANSTHAE